MMLFLKFILIMIMFFMTGNILKNEDTLKLFGAAGYVGSIFLIVLALFQMFDHFDIVKNEAYKINAVDMLLGFSVIYILFYLWNKSKSKGK